MQWLIQTIAAQVKEVEELDLFEEFKNMAAFRDKEFQAWVTQRKSMIARELELMNMAYVGDLEGIKKFIAEGINVNAAQYQGFTALYFAILRNDPKIISELMQAGANINVQDKNGNTPLMNVVSNFGNIPFVITGMLTTILQFNPSLNLRNKEGKTVFDIAAEKDYKEVLSILQAYQKQKKQ